MLLFSIPGLLFHNYNHAMENSVPNYREMGEGDVKRRIPVYLLQSTDGVTINTYHLHADCRLRRLVDIDHWGNYYAFTDGAKNVLHHKSLTMFILG